MPIALTTKGDSVWVGASNYAAESGVSLGDIRLAADVRLLGVYGDPFTLAAGVQLYTPTGRRESFTGDGKVRVLSRLQAAGRLNRFEYAARLALNYRAQQDFIDRAPIGTELAFAAIGGITALERLWLFGLELWGSTVLVNGGAFEKATTPLEIAAGAHWRPRDFHAGLGIGRGLTRGYGSPDVRVLAMFEWKPSALPLAAAGVTSGDIDLDGIPDVVDACPRAPGPANSDPEKNGCPIEDRDRDGVIDELDACPNAPGPASKVPEQSGCPLDEDGDGIEIPLDACPRAPGPPRDDPRQNGCPLARIERDQIVIGERIEFEFDSDRLLESSTPVLSAVLQILREHPELNVVLIEGHTDDIGTAEYNKDLSERRAVSVRQWFLADGMDPARLLDAGFGLERPIDTNHTPEGRQRNRRVEFHILERDGKRLDTMRTVDEH